MTTIPERGLTAEQLEMLLRGLSPNRVRQHKGNAHLEAWDIRKWLTRIFGFAGWSEECRSETLVHERIVPAKEEGKFRTTAVYRVSLRLHVRDVWGNEIGFFDGAAVGESVNQPSIGDAHDNALKTAYSQALKRCTIDLGDQFGLSLYNDGATDAVVIRTLGHPGLTQSADETAEDAPVVGGELGQPDPAEKAEEAEQGHRPAETSSATGAEEVRNKGPQPDAQPDVSFWDTGEGKHLLKTLHTLIAVKRGPKSGEERHAGFTKFCGRDITSAKQMNRVEVENFIAALRKLPDYVKPQPAPVDENENFRQAEQLARLEQTSAAEQLEEDLRDAIESSENPAELAGSMNAAVKARDEGRISSDQFTRLAQAADLRAARGRQMVGAR